MCYTILNYINVKNYKGKEMFIENKVIVFGNVIENF